MKEYQKKYYIKQKEEEQKRQKSCTYVRKCRKKRKAIKIEKEQEIHTEEKEMNELSDDPEEVI